MSVTDGQKANAANFNAAFVSKSVDSTMTSKLDLFNTAHVESGARVSNVQQAINEIWDTDGIVGLADAGAKTYSSMVYVADGDDRKVAIGKLDLAIFNLAAVVATKEDKVGPDGAFTFTNNSLAQDVTGLIFDKTIYRSVEVRWTIYRESTGTGGKIRVQRGSFMMIHDNTNWILTDGAMTSNPCGVIFDVHPLTGQVKIDADDNGGTTQVTHGLAFNTIDTVGV